MKRIPSATSILPDNITLANLRAKITYDQTGQKGKQNMRILDIPSVTSIYPLYKEKFPAHTYTVKIGEMLNAINKVKVGSHFIDFTASTADDRLVRISDSIKGKIALINLWASWCGPCRGLGKSMIPVMKNLNIKNLLSLEWPMNTKIKMLF